MTSTLVRLQPTWCAAALAAVLSACTGPALPAAGVSEQEARTAVARVVATAAERTPAALDRLCDENDGCTGMSSGTRHDPSTAPGPRDAPEVLCVVGLPPTPDQAGSQIVVLEGLDVQGRPYVSQVLVDRAADEDDEDGLQVQEPAFWMGIAYTALQHGRAWDALGDVPDQRAEHNTRAARPCTDTDAWVAEVAGSGTTPSS